MMQDRPNILLLMTDQQRYDSLGCCGASFAHTPNLDRLASQGVLFEHCYANNPICTPVRASMLTGKHLPGHGVYRLYDNLPLDEVLVSRRLQDCGYQTALFGKLHVSAIDTESFERHPHDGFDIYEPCIEGCARMDAPYQSYARWLREKDGSFHQRLVAEGRSLKHVPREFHMSNWAAERTIDFLSNRETGKPFFCMMSLFDPHNPYEHYPLEMGGLVNPARIPGPLLQVANGEPGDIARERHGSYLGDFDSFTAESLRHMRHGYHASVAYADLEFGRVLGALERQGLASNTLVIFVSDHGDMLGDHRLLVKGAYFYDPCVRVPLLMRWPGRFGGGRRVGGLVQSHDLAATMLAAAGATSAQRESWMPEALDLLPLADGVREEGHDFAVCCYRNTGINSANAYWDPPINATMVRDARFKLTCFQDPCGGPPAGELFDLESDPDELRNLWHDPALEKCRARLVNEAMAWERRFQEAPESRGGSTPPRVKMVNRIT